MFDSSASEATNQRNKTEATLKRIFSKRKKNVDHSKWKTHGMHTQSLSEYGHVFNANSFRKNTLRFLLNNIPILIESQTSSCLVFMGLVLVFFSSFTFANIVQYTIASIVK